jgi:hypothetical protein
MDELDSGVRGLTFDYKEILEPGGRKRQIGRIFILKNDFDERTGR